MIKDGVSVNSETELVQTLVSMIIQDLRQCGHGAIVNLIKKSGYTLDFLSHNNWDGGINYYYLDFYLPLSEYSKLIQKKNAYEEIVYNSLQSFFSDEHTKISGVRIKAKLAKFIDWVAIQPKENRDSVLQLINEEKDILIKAGTGIIQIRDSRENNSYKAKHQYLCNVLSKLGLSPVHNYNDLWDWYTDYNERELKSYQSRRVYLKELYSPLIHMIEDSEDNSIDLLHYEKTGWEKVDEDAQRMKEILEGAYKTQDFQSVGMYGRELLITLAQTVYRKDKHGSLDGVEISKTDSKRMLDAYVAYCLKNNNREREAKFARAAVDFSNELTHTRTAVSMDAELCYTAVLSTVHIIRVLNKHEPTGAF